MIESGRNKPFTISALSDRGMVREKNEDYFGIFEPEDERLLAQRGILAIVADGMGGHFSGGDASRMVVRVMGEEYYAESQDPPSKVLQAAFKTANRNVFDRIGEGRSGLAGTTCTAVALFPDHLDIAHAGDSRAYMVKKGEMKAVTEDHSVVGEMMRSGMIDREEARNHPRRNVITRAVGLREDVDPDIMEWIPFAEGDILMICSDGLSSMLKEDEILSILSGNNPEEACKALVKRANEEGGTDNITVVVARREPLR